ncbi:hypothetical protein C8F01DRAFT_549270 [Mycena amicta]|nr:hypothetical protein C8F01DRAFT_549270 [Mycena amicta]
MAHHEDPFAFWFDMACLWFGTLFYGIYVVLFCICIYILLHRPLRTPSAIVLLTTAIVMFVLSTVQAVINLVLGSGEILELDIPFDQIELADDMIYVLNNLVADGLLIYRCWIIWNHNYLVIAPGIAGLIITSVFGWDLNLPLAPFFGLTLATNLFITFLTAIRIWWIYHTSQRHLQSSSSIGPSKQYAAVIALIVESGVIYSVFVIARLAIQRDGLAFVVTEMLRQVVGIVPTLVIVRVGLGISTESSPSGSGSGSGFGSAKSNISAPFLMRSDSQSSFEFVEPPIARPSPSQPQPHYRRASAAVLAPLRSNNFKQQITDVEKNPGIQSNSTSPRSMTFAPNDSMQRPRTPPQRPLPGTPAGGGSARV